MPITYKNTNIERIKYRGVDVNKVIFNGTTVFTRHIVGDIAMDIQYTIASSTMYPHIIYAKITAIRLINGPFPTAITFKRTGNVGGYKVLGTIQPGETEIKNISKLDLMTVRVTQKQYEYVTIEYTDGTGAAKTVNVELDTVTSKKYNTTTTQQISYD